MKRLYIVIIILLSCSISFGQFNSILNIDDRPVRTPFDAGLIIDDQTVYMPSAKTLDFNIQHRFGEIKEISDLYGIYGSTNVRLGMNYTFTDWLQVGIGTTKLRKLQDLGIKLSLLEQTRKNKMPIALTLYWNMGIDCREDAFFGEQYQFSNRFSYFTQLIIARKFTEWFSIQVAPSYSHLNSVDSLYEHDKIGLSFTTRFKVSPQSSIIIMYDLPLELEFLQTYRTVKDPPKPNFGIGFEVATSTHAFQIFVSTATDLSSQYIFMENQNDWTDGVLFFGFYINRLWSF